MKGHKRGREKNRLSLQRRNGKMRNRKKRKQHSRGEEKESA